MPIADLSHPTSSRQVIVMNDASTIWFTFRVEAENNSHRFTPIGTLFCGIEQTEIRHEMPLVIGRKLRTGRRSVFKGGYAHQQPRWHGRSRISDTGSEAVPLVDDADWASRVSLGAPCYPHCIAGLCGSELGVLKCGCAGTTGGPTDTYYS